VTTRNVGLGEVYSFVWSPRRENVICPCWEWMRKNPPLSAVIIRIVTLSRLENGTFSFRRCIRTYNHGAFLNTERKPEVLNSLVLPFRALHVNYPPSKAVSSSSIAITSFNHARCLLRPNGCVADPPEEDDSSAVIVFPAV
jgi:hypothetical protein